jgi:hypothetical protein
MGTPGRISGFTVYTYSVNLWLNASEKVKLALLSSLGLQKVEAPRI